MCDWVLILAIGEDCEDDSEFELGTYILIEGLCRT